MDDEANHLGSSEWRWPANPEAEAVELPGPSAPLAERLAVDLAQLLPIRLANALESAGILTVGALLACGPDRVLAIPQVGAKGLAAIYARLERLGFFREARDGHPRLAVDHQRPLPGGRTCQRSPAAGE